ncbi:cell division protein SepF [Niameybacter massiliensis]|uniref:Cell division protein SepF n=1 Tax=Holtiella tumoricola TaxID=3018743 RepID=A0AA42DNH6_9FIRM|nr:MULTISPECIES: cell division protein SepF [Lachnospirales]MDA3732562.1 cell division protein SepF [Holtiella tumoricola]
MKAIMTRMKDILFSNEDFEDEEDEFEETQPMQQEPIQPRPRPASTLNMPQMQPRLAPVTPAPTQASTKEKMEILNFTMSAYEMTGEVATYIKNRKPIIVNMKNLTPGEVQRAVDYLTGACFALNGTVECITDQIYIFAPESVNITPEVIKQKNMWPTA